MEKNKYDLISAIFLAKSIIDDNLDLLSSKQQDRQFLGTDKFDIYKSVPLHTCTLPLVKFTRSSLRKQKGASLVKLKIHKVNTSEYNHTGSTMSGMMFKETETNDYVILLHDGETYCTQRFSLCKELAEVLVACITETTPAIHQIDPTSAILEAIREVVQKFYFSTKTPKLTDKFDSTESFSHAIALELMIPYKLRTEISEDIKKGHSNRQIAERLWITEETLDEYLKNYFDITTPIYSMIK